MEVSGVIDDFCGTVVTFPANNNTPFMQNWVIGKQLSEHIHRFTNHKIGEGLGSSFAARKFTCHIENGTETGIMRIHLHVPNLRTEFHNSAHRAVQTAKSPGHAEIAAFKTLQSAQSHVAPRLLALREDAQGNDGLIPGGYIDYLA